MSMICGPIRGKALGGINEEVSGGIRCVYGRWAHTCLNASRRLPIPPKLRGLEIHYNSFSIVIFSIKGIIVNSQLCFE